MHLYNNIINTKVSIGINTYHKGQHKIMNGGAKYIRVFTENLSYVQLLSLLWSYKKWIQQIRVGKPY